MMKKTTVFLTFLLLIAGGKVFAQGCGGPVSDEGLKMFGFLQSQYEYQLSDPAKNSFTFERARIGVQGAIPYDFSYYVVAELSPFVANYPYLLDAFISYNRYEWAKVSIGQFKNPFGLETNTACNDLMTVYRSTATNQISVPFRDIGIIFMGGTPTSKIKYQFAVMNGSGVGKFDNNTKKDITARVVYSPFEFVSIGGSFRYGFPSLNNNTDNRTSFGGEIKANYMNFTLLGEYIMDEGDYNRDLGGGCSGNLILLGEKRSGGYATLAYRTKWNVEPVVKFDFFDSGNTEAYKESNLTFGFNYYFNDWTRLQANYILRSEQPAEFTNDEFVIQLQVKF